jgi:hypothetical protein
VPVPHTQRLRGSGNTAPSGEDNVLHDLSPRAGILRGQKFLISPSTHNMPPSSSLPESSGFPPPALRSSAAHTNPLASRRLCRQLLFSRPHTGLPHSLFVVVIYVVIWYRSLPRLQSCAPQHDTNNLCMTQAETTNTRITQAQAPMTRPHFTQAQITPTMTHPYTQAHQIMRPYITQAQK